MPIYEYRCLNCHNRFEVLILRSKKEEIVCPNCNKMEYERILSRVYYYKTEKQRLSEYDITRPPTEDFYKDPRNIGLWAKKKAQQLGVDLPDKFEEKLDKARSGELMKEMRE